MQWILTHLLNIKNKKISVQKKVENGIPLTSCLPAMFVLALLKPVPKKSKILKKRNLINNGAYENGLNGPLFE